MKTSLFDFDLPQDMIAASPAFPRDSARMLVVDVEADGKLSSLSDDKVSSFSDYISSGDVVVFNNTKVIPARLKGKRGEALVEILLHKNLSSENSNKDKDYQHIWSCFAKPAKRLKIDDVIMFAADFSAVVQSKSNSGEVILEFDVGIKQNHDDFMRKIEKYGKMPLPPYIEKKRSADYLQNDKDDYQTIYAKNEGSVAAPTAGLHFTEQMFDKIDKLGAKKVFITLHVGGGTFLPVKSEDIKDHVMHSEFMHISEENAAVINKAIEAGKKIIAVGTTSLRALESASLEDGKISSYSGETAIFITPSYRFRVVNMLLTNFHLPRSTLFMLVCAFSGLENMQEAYKHAIKNNYRFYSYGDACLLKNRSDFSIAS